MLRTIWGDNDRYLSTYWEKFRNRYYVAGDSARRDKDGYYWIMGRIDDVLNVAGHRLGTMEIESALVAHPRVAESAVVSRPHEIKGESVFAYVVLNVPRPEGAAAKALIEELRSWVGEQLSPIAKPDEIRLTENLPKTRSGKIMRRLLRSIARGEEITQDMSTLENPAILEQLRGGAPTAAAEKPIKAASPVKKPKLVEPVKPVKAVTPVKRAKPAKPVKRAKSAKQVKPVKRVKTAKRVKAAKRAKPAAKRGKQVKRALTVKRAKRPAAAGKSRTAVKSIRRKSRSKK
jgi:outer membrane biosynthesis protein TonB